MADVKAAIDEVVIPRIAEHRALLPYVPENPLVLETSSGLEASDQYGNRYLDFTSGGLGALPLGHNHPAVMSAVGEQMRQYQRFGAPGQHVLRMPVEYARALADSLPGEDLQVLFTTDEHAAFSAAMTLAQKSTDRLHLTREVETETRYHDTAALILDLITGKARPLHQADVVRAAASARGAGALVIADESRGGMGRTGRMWTQDRWGVTADITVLGGAVGGGFPLGAVVAPARLFEQVPLTPHPMAGHPAIVSAGLATLRTISDPLLEHVVAMGQVLHEGLTDLCWQFSDVFVTSQGVGLLQALECVTEAVAASLVTACREVGLLVERRGAHIPLQPPLLIAETQLRAGVDLIAGACLDLHEEA